MMESEGTELTYSDMLRILRESWVAILLLTVGCGLTAVIIALMMRPVYRAEVLLAPAATEAGAGSSLSRLAGQYAPLAGLIGNMDSSGGFENKEVRLATLRSRRFTEDFIRDEKLLPVLFQKDWDHAADRWKVRNGKPSTPTMFDAVRMFNEDIRTVSEDRRTGLITLAIEWSDPDVAAQWSNELVARANESLRQRAIEESQRSITFLEEELQKANVVERQQIIYNLIESKTREIMMASSRKDFAFVIIDPAVAPQPGHFVRPRRTVIAAAGLFLGFLIGVTYASVRWVNKPRREM